MKSISKLKDEARRYEQREEWERAIEVYLQVLRADDESEVELTLFNRVGDLCVRLGRPLDAVRYYEEAADRYADLGLYNNAIALCNKALRYQPDHLELMRKLGQFSASQGFLTDARRYFLEYAERKFRHGETDAALAALADFAGVVDDGEIRELLGRRLHAYGRNVDALRELRTAYAMYVHTGESDRAESVRSTIHAIDPSAQLDAAPHQADDPFTERPARESDDLPRFEPLGTQPAAAAHAPLPGVPGPAPVPPTPPPVGDTPPAPSRDATDAARVDGFERTGLGSFDEDQEDDAIIELPYLDIDDDRPTPAEAKPSADPISGFEATTLDFGTESRDLHGLDLGPGLQREESPFDADDHDDVTFLIDGESANYPGQDLVHGAGTEPDLPYLDDEETPSFDLPLLDDEPDAEPLPFLDDGFGGAGEDDSPEEEAYAGESDLPLLDDGLAAAAGDTEPDDLDDVQRFGDADETPLDGTDDDEAAPLPLPEFGIHGELMAEPPIFEFERPAPPVHTESAAALFGPDDLMPADAADPTADAGDPVELEGAPAPPLDLPDWLEVAIDHDDPTVQAAGQPADSDILSGEAAPPGGPVAPEAGDGDGAAFDFPSVGDFWQDEEALLRPDDETASEPAEAGGDDPDFWRDAPPVRPQERGAPPPWQAFADAAWQSAEPTPAAPDEPYVPDAPGEPWDGWDATGDTAEIDPVADGAASPDFGDFPDSQEEVRTNADADPADAAPWMSHDLSAESRDAAVEPVEASGSRTEDVPAADVFEPLDDERAAAADDAFEFETTGADETFEAGDGPLLHAPFVFADDDSADPMDDVHVLDVAARAAAEAAAAAKAAEAHIAEPESAEPESAEPEWEAAAAPVDGTLLHEDRESGDDAAAADGWTPDRLLDEPAAAAHASAAGTPAGAQPPEDDGYVDLGAMLRDEQEETTRFYVQETAPTGDEDRDFAELLRQFKAKVSQHVPAEDAVAHYDLALAYKEMGLLDEAIAAFQVALRAGRMRLKIYEELGECFLQKRQFNIAEKVLSRALATGHEDELELLGVYYHLGRAYEAMGRTEQARDAYERVLGMDIGFQDVAERLARL